MNTNPTRMTSTEEGYTKRALQMSARFQREKGVPLLEASIDAVHWLIDQKPFIKQATWRTYKATFCYWFELHEENEALTLLASVTSDGCQNSEGRTSSKKRKGCKPSQYEKIVEYLVARSNKPTAILVLNWIQATKATGLRPGEWLGCQINDTELVVKNAKNSNGRTFGDYRTLDLSNLDSSIMCSIHFIMNYFEDITKEEFESTYDRVRKYLQRINEKVFPNESKNITLYTFRHQFSANLKSSGASKKVVAAAMGHGNIDTAGTHYARRSQGDGGSIGFTAIPSSESIMAVANRYPEKNQSTPAKDS